MSHLNGIQSKQLNQLNSKDGEAFTATSAPGWFIKGNSTYGEAFSPERPGNLVKFFTTGSDYFKDVASAIKNAKKSIFISGWQINYEVRLEGDTRLWDCLNHALRKKVRRRISTSCRGCPPRLPSILATWKPWWLHLF
ncbi:hypothetical protein RCC30_19310 [Pseudomonas fluorescens]|nr:hypothetical protein RCC30_19310 [Pseudomonas fluorescens]